MTLDGLDRSRPFVVATGGAADPSLMALLRAEPAELEAVLGVGVELAERVPDGRSGWEVVVDPAADVNELRWDTPRQRLTALLPDPARHGVAVNLLHTLAHAPGTTARDDDATTPAEVLDRVEAEVLHVWPSFDLRAVDRERWAAARPDPDQSDEGFVLALQRWVAGLGDAHTAVHRLPRPTHHPAYAGALTSRGLELTGVPEDSDAARAGVGPGWVVEVEDPARWLSTTGATPHMHARVAARRFLAMAGPTRPLVATGPGGQRRRWTEHVRERPDVELDEDRARVRLAGFGPGTLDRVAWALDRLAGRREVTLDLRGNAGGRLLSATEIRAMLLHEPVVVGTIRFTDGRGGLADPVEVRAEPGERTWPGRVRLLVDAMTYSAAEDLVWGLQGLPHVRVEGSRTGGGSGRPHTRRLRADLALTVSTALTQDRSGRCLEGAGWSPDARWSTGR